MTVRDLIGKLVAWDELTIMVFHDNKFCYEKRMYGIRDLGLLADVKVLRWTCHMNEVLGMTIGVAI